MPRSEFTRKTKAAAFIRCNGHCEAPDCGARLKAGEAEYDHIREASNGGTADLSNCQVLCAPCHKAKTKAGTQTMRRMERARDRQNGALKTPAKAIQSRGFQIKPKAKRLPLPTTPNRSPLYRAAMENHDG